MMHALDYRHEIDPEMPSRIRAIAPGDINPATGKPYAINPSSGVWDDNYFANTYSRMGSTSSGGGTTSGGSILPDFSGAISSAKQGLSDVLNRTAQTESDFLTRFRAAISGTPATGTTPATLGLAERIQNELGIPQLSATSAKLNTMLTNMPFTQGAATRGFNVNQNQLDRIIAQKAGELAPTATATANELAAKIPLAQTRLQTELMPFQTEAGMISDRSAREVTGYTDVMQKELDTIIEKMKAGVTLSEGEADRANALALKEQDYINATKADNQVVEANGRKLLVNMSTGSVIADLGSATSGSGGVDLSAYLGDKNVSPTTLQPTAAPSYFKPLDFSFNGAGGSAQLRG